MPQGGRPTPHSRMVHLLKVLMPLGLRVRHNSLSEGPKDEPTKYASVKPQSAYYIHEGQMVVDLYPPRVVGLPLIAGWSTCSRSSYPWDFA